MNQHDRAIEVAKEQGKVIIFQSSRNACGNCTFMSPKVEAICNDSAGKIVWVKVNVDECEQVSFKDMPQGGGLPMLKVYANGKLVGTCGGCAEDKLKQICQEGMNMA